MFKRAGRYARNGLALVGFATLGGGLIITQRVGSVQKRVREESMKLPDKFIIELDLETKELVEKVPDLLKLLGQAQDKLEVRKVVKGLAAAGGDARVQGLVAYVGDTMATAGLAVVQELRDGVQDFRTKAAGRAVCVACSDSFGESGTAGTASYFLASAFEKVYVQPTGLVSITGLAAQGTFFKRLLEKWSVRSYFTRREEYKSAADWVIAEKFNGPSREAMEQLLTSMKDSITQGVAQSRGLPREAVEAAIDEAPLPAQRAVELKLLDGAKYRDEILASLGTQDTTTKRVAFSRYLQVLEAKETEQRKKDGLLRMLASITEEDDGEGRNAAVKPEVAVIHAEGAIMTGGPKGRGANPTGSPVIDSSKLCKTLRELRESKAVRAVVLRINSPGGSAVASDVIHREVAELKASGKPVVVSMGNYAASGGYYISAPATRIVAQPATITGSIGVVFGKVNISGGLNQVGITSDVVSVGRNAAAMSPFTDFTPQQEQEAEALTDSVYQHFLTRVSEGRRLSMAATREVAKGRVWSGADALRLGLVDRLGGLQDAIALARQEAGLPEKEADAVEYPKPKSPAQLLRSFLKGEPLEASIAVSPTVGGVPAILASMQPLLLAAGAFAAAHSSGGGLAALAASQPPGGVANVIGSTCAQQAAVAAAAAQGGPQMVCGVSVR